MRPLPEVVASPGQLIDCAFFSSDEVEILAIPIAPAVEGGEDLQPRHGTVDAAVRYGIDFAELADRARLTGRPGEAHIIDLPRPNGRSKALPWAGLPERIILLGVGDGSVGALRRAGAGLARATRGAERVLTTVAGYSAIHGVNAADGELTRAFVEGYLLGAYTFPSAQTGEAAPEPAEQLVLLGEHSEGAVSAAVIAASATWLARDLTNTPSNLKTPDWLAIRAQGLAHEAGLKTRVWDKAALRDEGFGGILAVGAGSEHEPRLVMVTYTPLTDDGEELTGAPHVVLVGKGITYDTGGISIKPRLAMVPMKTDMAGAAVVLGVVLGAAHMKSKHKVTALLPLAENHFGSDSYRPGDVLQMFGGTNVEVSNTDAEGRLVLADALAFAEAELSPDVLIDIATLTGAASLGLGTSHAAAYSADESLMASTLAAADASGEKAWHMPLVEDYAPALAAPVADLSHVDLDGWGAGSITAAMFLREFTTTTSWLHLDIAGPARASKDRHEVSAGATGYGARLLLRLLEGLE